MTNEKLMCCSGCYPWIENIQRNGYTVEGIIGSGPNGVVCKVKDVKNDEILAIKVYDHLSVTNLEKRSDEKVVSALDFVNPIERVFTVDQRAFFVSPFCDAGNLETYFIETDAFGNLQVIKPIAYDILYGMTILQKTHGPHNNLKPSNILFTTLPEWKRKPGFLPVQTKICAYEFPEVERCAKIMIGGQKYADDEDGGCDFDEDSSRDNDVAMTECYVTKDLLFMAPETLRGDLVDARSEVWSFGCVLLFMMLGWRPWLQFPNDLAFVYRMQEGRSFSIPTKVPLVDQIIQACLQLDPINRTTTFSDILQMPFFADMAGER